MMTIDTIENEETSNQNIFLLIIVSLNYIEGIFNHTNDENKQQYKQEGSNLPSSIHF